jgi:4,5-DOPA dioxygenase extradiol
VADDNPQIYDMYGFPDELYKIKYAPKSDTAIAIKVLSLLGKAATL